MIEIQDEQFTGEVQTQEDNSNGMGIRYGYWENWNYAVTPGPGTINDASYYENDLRNINRFGYSFLTLA